MASGYLVQFGLTWAPNLIGNQDAMTGNLKWKFKATTVLFCFCFLFFFLVVGEEDGGRGGIKNLNHGLEAYQHIT